MHELATTQSLVNIVEAEAGEKGFERVLEIRLKVGEYSGIVPQCLMDFFPIVAAGTHAEGAALVIEPVKARFECLDCGYDGEADRKNACCARCGSTALKISAGREFYVDSIKVE